MAAIAFISSFPTGGRRPGAPWRSAATRRWAMVDATGGPEVEIVRLVFKSWEHRWVTGVRMAASTASAHRLMPETTTEPIYDILYERELLRDTMPLSPYGL